VLKIKLYYLRDVEMILLQTERRMNDIRDTIQQWESIDRTRNDLRNWLHSKQEELHDLESRPTKLHSEAAELEIANLQVNRPQTAISKRDTTSKYDKDIIMHDDKTIHFYAGSSGGSYSKRTRDRKICE
jgi:hypothetical protein